MQFLLFGADSFRSRKKLAALRAHFQATRDVTGMNIATFTAGRQSAADAAQAIVASPFLAERKMVVLEGFLRAAASEQEQIRATLERQPESTVVIAYETADADALDKSPLFDMLRVQQYTEEFAALSPAAAERFAMDEAAALGAQLEPRAARLLVTLAGTDSWMLHTEAAKLAAYALSRKHAAITEQDVATTVSDGREAEIFAFLDACAEGRSGMAAQMLESLLSGGASELQIVSMLQKHYRAAVAAADMLAHGVRGDQNDAGTLAAQLGMHPFPAGKALQFARRHGAAGLVRAWEKLIEMERAAKSGGFKTTVVLTGFIAGPER